jgi:hypothetical protein
LPHTQKGEKKEKRNGGQLNGTYNYDFHVLNVSTSVKKDTIAWSNKEMEKKSTTLRKKVKL